jgi:hypothetical protein
MKKSDPTCHALAVSDISMPAVQEEKGQPMTSLHILTSPRRVAAGAALAVLAAAATGRSAEIEMLDGSVTRGKIVKETATAIEVSVTVPGRGSAVLTIPKSKVHAIRDGGETRVVNAKPAAAEASSARKPSPASLPASGTGSAGAGRPSAASSAKSEASDKGAYRPPEKVPRTGIGFRGDGTGVYPDSRPPVEWDEASGKNILWKAPLPNWGYSSPVPVGNRVYFVSEPGWKSKWPELCIFDADTGRLLRQVPVDPCDAFPDMTEASRKAVAEAVEALYEQGRMAYRIAAPLEKLGSADKDHPEVVKANEELAKYGMAIGGYKQGYGLLRQLRYTDDRRKKWEGIFKPYGLKPECTWQGFGRARVGLAFPTPVSDGERIYVMTYHGTVACFDMEGRRLWSASAGYTGHHGLMASPRLWDDILLTGWFDTGGFDPRLMAWDKRTGRKLWEAKVSGSRNPEAQSRPGGAVVVITVGETPIALCSTGGVVRLPDGKVFSAAIDKSCGTFAVDDETDAVFGCGHHDRGSVRWGIELKLVGGELEVKERFATKRDYGPVSAVFAAGRLFADCAQIDPLTGKFHGQSGGDPTQKPGSAPRTSPRSRHLILVAGGHVYGLYEEAPKGERPRGVSEVFAVDGRKVATNVLLAAPREGEKAEQWLVQGWGGPSFSYCCAMNIGGDRLYACSDDYLYCIGAR